ncbi:MAG: hypothetical protein JNM17_22535, partial [Archangium sp.]|nr:hypothetical protein [Archangium sp.]
DPTLLDNPPSLAAGTPWSLGLNSAGVVRAVFERDAGLLIATWGTMSTAVNTTWRPVRLPADTISSLALSDDATWVAWDGDYNDGGGSTESTGAVEQLEGATVVPRESVSYKYLVTTSGRVQGFDTYSSYFNFPPFPVIDESGLSYCPDVTQTTGTCVGLNVNGNHTLISGGRAARLGNEMVVGWIDNKQLWVGQALPTVGQIRQRKIDAAGTSVADLDLAGPVGANFMTLFYRTLSGSATSVYGTLVCPP